MDGINKTDKAILIAGKDLPAGEGFARGMAVAGYGVVAATMPEGDGASVSMHEILAAPWNRASPISARSLVLQAETAFGAIDVAALYFDSSVYAAQFTTLSPEECSRAADTLILGYQYLTIEILKRIEERKTNGTLIFIARHHPGAAELLRAASRGGLAPAANPFVSAAEAAFTAFAENVAALMLEKQNVKTLLVSCEARNEVSSNDASLAAWLSEYLAAMNDEKNKPNARRALIWTKPGEKAGGLFSRFL